MVSKEGDHERGTYLMKTGYRPDPTVEHPLDRRGLLPRAAGGPDRHSAAYLDPDRSVAAAAAASWAPNSTLSRPAIRKEPFPT